MGTLVEGQITVTQLIVQLQNAVLNGDISPDAAVWCDGCDCTGEAGGVDFNTGNDTVEIVRVDHM